MTQVLKFPWNAPTRMYTRSLYGKKGKLVLPNLPSGFDMGRNSYVNDGAEVRCFRKIHMVRVGAYSSLGRCTFLVDGDHNIKFASTFPFREFGLCSLAPDNANHKSVPLVENDVWIADGATIMGGVTIGNGAVIAANSVVTKDVPPYAMAAGNPACIVKYRFDDDTIARFMKVQWWDMPDVFVFNELAPLLDQPDEFLKRAERGYNV